MTREVAFANLSPRSAFPSNSILHQFCSAAVSAAHGFNNKACLAMTACNINIDEHLIVSIATSMKSAESFNLSKALIISSLGTSFRIAVSIFTVNARRALDTHVMAIVSLQALPAIW